MAEAEDEAAAAAAEEDAGRRPLEALEVGDAGEMRQVALFGWRVHATSRSPWYATHRRTAGGLMVELL